MGNDVKVFNSVKSLINSTITCFCFNDTRGIPDRYINGCRKDNWDRNIYDYSKDIPDRYMCDNRKRNSDHCM